MKLSNLLYTCFYTLLALLFVNALSGQFNHKLIEQLEWRELGPYRGGRSCAVTGVSGNDNLFYFGSTGGGIWQSEDGGRSWQNISDGFFGGSIGAIAVAESDPNVIYVGGGEKTVRGNVSHGYGIWKTEDKGKTWSLMGLEKSRHISRIRIHPTNHNILYAAVMGDLYKDTEERGIYKSVDGGETWKRVLFSNASSGFVDLIMDPGNPRILYASSWKIRRTPYSLSSGGEGSALWKSTDSGETWTNISDNKGLPEGTWGISGVTVSPVDSDRIWAIIENENGGVFRSDDGGDNWIKTNSSRSLRQRAWYYSRIYADPEDADIVYVVNVAYHKSKDGGKTFESFRAPHGDHHDLWIDPQNSKRMIIGDDGGAQITYDGGNTWTSYHNQPTAQFYRVTTDNHFPYRIYAAQQDNSTIRILSRTRDNSITEKHWESTAGGESAHIAVDPLDNDIVYGGSYGGFLTRLDHNTGHYRAINVWPDNPMGHGAEDFKYRFQWNFPIFFSKHNPKKLYTASNHLHLSIDEGQSWQTVSPDLTRNDPDKLKSSGGPITQDNTGVEYYCTIFAVEESPLVEGLIWAGSDDGLIHLTQDGGTNWTNVTPSQAPDWIMINCIEPSPFDEGTCYVAATMYKSGDFRPYLFKTNNYGQSWQKITNGIDEEHFTRAIRCDRKQDGVLYAGTESGMYMSVDDGQNWQSFQMNLPVVPITDIALKENDIIVSTQGRGLWVLDNLDLVKQTIDKDTINTILFQPEDNYLMNGGQSKNTKGAGTNHYSGINIHYYLTEYDENDTLGVIIIDMNGDTVRQYSNHSDDKNSKINDVKKGANVLNWNMKYDGAEDFEGMIMWWASLSGARALPGMYKAVFKYKDFQEEVNFKVLKDPSLGIPEEDYRLQFEFIQSINSKVTEAHSTIKEIRSLNKQMQDFASAHKIEKIDSTVQHIDSLLTDVEKSLYQTQNKSNQDPLNFPIKLTNKLAHLNSLVQVGYFRPTDQMYEVRDELIALIDAELIEFKSIKENEIKQLNALIRREVSEFIK